MNNSSFSKNGLLEDKEQLGTAKMSSEDYTNRLFRNEELFSQAMRGANDGLWDWNLETDEIYYSPRWKSLLGYSENEIDQSRKTWAVLIHNEDKDRVFAEIQQHLESEAESFTVSMRMYHKDERPIYVESRIFLVIRNDDHKTVRMVGTLADVTTYKKAQSYNEKNAQILEMIALGRSASDIYDAIALMYEERHPGLRCSMLELHGNKLLHGGAPSLPKAYCDNVNGLEYGPEAGSCGTSTYTGKRVVVENIDIDPKWKDIKHVALPHGMRCCWSEPIKSSSGKVLGAFGMYYNHTAVPNEEESTDLTSAARLASIVMERDQDQKRIRDLAYSDELTGIPSRPFFHQNLEQTIRHCDRYNRRFGLLYIDLDNFKGINDSLGHNIGDQLLQAIATRLKSVCRDIDFVARLSGDEFCVIVKEIDDYSTTQIAQRCLEEVSRPVELLARKFTPACSIGIAHYPDDAGDLSSLLKAADISLYAAKENGKNQYAFYKPELTEKAEYLFLVEQYLREAIEKQQLTLVYQPKINVNTGEIIGVEALSRWHHHELGHVSPIEFISTAERIGMIKPLTEWVLDTACRQAVAWRKQGFNHLTMAVNISPSHFLDEAIVPLLTRTFDETRITPEELELEVTESAVQTDERNLLIFQHLKDLGIQLAIDDFGSGYSSFASLKHLNVDCLKIDKFFVDDIANDKKSLSLISSMIEMGQNLGYKITAEGVETSEQFNILKQLGCENAQGYLFSKPVGADEISKLLSNQLSERKRA